MYVHVVSVCMMWLFYVLLVVRMPKDIELKHSITVEDATNYQVTDSYFDMDQPSPHHRTKSVAQSAGDNSSELEGEEKRGAISKTWQFVVKMLITFVDLFTEWLEEKSSLYREVVEAVLEGGKVRSCTSSPQNVNLQESALERLGGPDQQMPQLVTQSEQHVDVDDHEDDVQLEDHISVDSKDDFKLKQHVDDEDEVKSKHHDVDEDEVKSKQHVVDDEEVKSKEEGSTTGRVAASIQPASGGGGAEHGVNFNFDHRGDILERELHLEPSANTLRETEEYEAKLVDQTNIYTRRMSRLFRAIYYVLLSRSDFVVYFLIILNVILNGSLLSLLFAMLLYGWGLLSTPWPSKRFWLTLIFYSMVMIVIKYCSQFSEIKFSGDKGDGLYLPDLFGIGKEDDFLLNAMWDMWLLIALLINRALLKVRDAVWECGGEGSGSVVGETGRERRRWWEKQEERGRYGERNRRRGGVGRNMKREEVVGETGRERRRWWEDGRK